MSNDNKTYICKRCGYKATQKINLQTHLKRKQECQCTLSNTSREDLLQELQKPDRLNCKHCNQTFKNYSAKYRHQKQCHSNDDRSELAAMRQEITFLRNKIESLQNTASTTNNTNCNNTYNTNITLNNFCDEKINHLSERLLVSCLVDMDMPRLLEQIHFDPKHPENHTVGSFL